MTHFRFGLLSINKPSGMTSRRVVDAVLRLVGKEKVGHAGTLDPLASGVLVVCVGQATRLIPLIQQSPKEYRARFLLGKQSDTDDITGNVTEVSSAAEVTRRQVEELLPRFLGKIQQVPPQFSAVHVNGRRAYKLARAGCEVSLEPKRVEIHRLSVVEMAYPQLELDIECGSGTYIRSLGRDLGKLLGCGAVMSALVRTRIGFFRLEEATPLDRLDQQTLSEAFLPATVAVSGLSKVSCILEDLDDIRCGRLVPLRQKPAFADGETLAVIAPDGDLACLAKFQSSDGTLAPKQVFLPQE